MLCQSKDWGMGPPSVLLATAMSMKKNLANSKNIRRNNRCAYIGAQRVTVHVDEKGMTINATRGGHMLPANRIKDCAQAIMMLEQQQVQNQATSLNVVYEFYKRILSDVKSLLTDPQTAADAKKIGKNLKAIKAIGYEVQEYDPSDEFEPVK